LYIFLNFERIISLICETIVYLNINFNLTLNYFIMKKITLLVAAMFFAFAANAQLVEVVEDFESGAFPAGWSSVVNTGDCDVSFGADMPTGPSFPSSAVYFDDDACGNGMDPSNVTIYSDVYDLSSSDGVVTVGYDVAFQEVAAGDTFLAEVNAGDGWETLALYDVDLAEILTESFDGTATNEDFQVRWTFDDAGEWAWHGAIDNFNLTYTNVLGVSDDAVEGFSFAPNPAQDVLNLNAQTNIERATIVNVLGQTVIDAEINATSSTLDISSLAAGTYILKVAVGDETGTYHIIKE
jgi:hypothetical protein